MIVCTVQGTVTATVRHKAFSGKKLMIVSPLESDEEILAVDNAQAGIGDTVLVLREGGGIRQILNEGSHVPIRSLIVGIVDSLTISGDKK